MYEILKQYEKKGERIIAVDKLRELIGVLPSEYERWDRFKYSVLDACQEALKENTDIEYTYEPLKKGKHGKIMELRFTIKKNADYTDQICLEEFIDSLKEKKWPTKEDEIIDAYGELNIFKKKLSDDEILNLNQIAFDYLLAHDKLGDHPLADQMEYVRRQALFINTKKDIKNYKAYLTSAVKDNYAKSHS